MVGKTFIQSIFVDPPIAVARLGASPAPQDAYEWAQSDNPRTEGETVVVPTWSLNVLPDGSVEPIMPVDVKLRDGDQIRPVCPFFEVWAMVSALPTDPPDAWEEAPLTTGLLQASGVTETAVRLRIDARNRKAARRADNNRLTFGTFPAVTVRGDRHTRVDLPGVSPPDVPASRRMIPPNRSIALGSVQVMRPTAQPAAPTAWSDEGIRLDVIRFRFTPARGGFYGPPAAGQTTPPAVTPGTHDFLRAGAGWFGSSRDARPEPLGVVVPPDTIDEDDDERSLGVVDDTCEARIEVALSLPGRGALSAHTTVFVAPPDFAPDRRPFLSVADELNDRAGDGATRDAALSAEDREAWVEDLFERISEVVALLNVDHYRARFAVSLPANRLRPAPGIAGDRLPEPTRAMGARDRLRNPDLEPLLRADPVERPLPLSVRARERHRHLSDLDALRAFVQEHPGRLKELVRGPFEIEAIEAAPGPGGEPDQTMRMPPFMRNSNFNPLTLSAWQYALLMEWVRVTEPAPGVRRVARDEAAPLPAFAAERREAVLRRLGRRGTR